LTATVAVVVIVPSETLIVAGVPPVGLTARKLTVFPVRLTVTFAEFELTPSVPDPV
jgi:hypothetical protein